MRLRNAVMAHPLVTLVILLGLVGVASASVPAFKASEAPAFCNSCHEMRPYYAAWSAGSHRTVDCVDCHVDPGTVNHVTHKVTAAKELAVHVVGDPKFPGGNVNVPDARCLACHADIATKKTRTGFEHATHVKQAACITCHSTVGHRVTLETLKANNLLKPGIELAKAGASVQTTASGEATSALHLKITCSQCHDLNTVRCSLCHQPKHQARGACGTCHRPGAKFVFAHPSSTECAQCHKTPTRHFPGSCATCHVPATSFKTVSFDHKDATACTACHSAPRRHFPGACSTCHSPATAFKATVFRHTSNACASCHPRPVKHFGGACSSCHSPGTPFKATVFRHTSNACASCHARPAGHRSGQCAACHARRGVSWAFTHPASKSCGSCHRPPSKHYGTVCATCHRTSQAFAKAVFRHAASMNCAQCHKAPSGHYGTRCNACHTPSKPFASAVFRHVAGLNCAQCHKSGHRSYPVACASCHTRAGVSWARVHTSSKACASCHSAPSSHYGTTCASCHSPSRAWSSATFTHPRVQEHTYKSFACTKCHPNGYASHYCSCHPGGKPPSD